jgi:hypothetical protein
MKQLTNNFKKYKWFFTSSNKLVVGGKNASQNDELLSIIKKEKKEFIILHTSKPGSPFSVILSNIKNVTKPDIEETAIFTACFSQQWKLGKKTTEVDIFNSSQISKSINMKIGTWGVLGNVKTVLVPLELFLTRQKNILRAVPEKSAKRPIAKILPGKIDKKDILSKIPILKKEKISQEELLSALPAGGIKIEKIR